MDPQARIELSADGDDEGAYDESFVIALAAGAVFLSAFAARLLIDTDARYRVRRLMIARIKHHMPPTAAPIARPVRRLSGNGKSATLCAVYMPMSPAPVIAAHFNIGFLCGEFARSCWVPVATLRSAATGMAQK
jgi:hypothetical protein